MEWKNALQKFEQTPPTHCWSEIQEVLDQDLPEVRKRLLTFEEPPPSYLKRKIFDQLADSRFPHQLKIRRSRAIAAASIAVVVGLSALYLLFVPTYSPKVGASLAGARKPDSAIRMQQSENGYIWLYPKNESPVRISPKLLEIIPALRDSQDPNVSEWQKQIVESSFIPSGFNFMDIAELSRLLEEQNP